MAGSMRTFVTDGQTDGQTDGADYIGPEAGPKNVYYMRTSQVIVVMRYSKMSLCD